MGVLRIIVLCACAGLLFAPPPCSAGDRVVFNTGEWPPYTSESLPHGGCLAEQVSAVCAAAGIEPAFVFLPWARAEAGVGGGEVFAALPYAFTPRRAEKYTFSDVLFYGETVVMVRADNARVKAHWTDGESAKEMRELTFGVLIGSYQANVLADAGIQATQTPKAEQLIDMLRLGRLDCIVDEKAVLLHYARLKYPEDANFRIIRIKEFGKQPNGLIVSRNYPGGAVLVERFNEAVRKLRKSGEYAAIAKRCNLDVEP